MDMNEYFLSLGSVDAPVVEKVLVGASSEQIFAPQAESTRDRSKRPKAKQKTPEQYQETLF